MTLKVRMENGLKRTDPTQLTEGHAVGTNCAFDWVEKWTTGLVRIEFYTQVVRINIYIHDQYICNSDA